MPTAYYAKWYEKNRTKVLARKKIYREQHREHIKKVLADYYDKNSVELRKRARLYAAAHKTDRRNRELNKTYGPSAAEYATLLEKQKYVCAICSKTNRSSALAVDHDHNTGKIRGLLCGNCNNGLGRFKDSTGLLRAAAVYLERC